MPHRVYPDLATLRAALGGPVELRLLEDQGDDVLLSAAFGQLADLGGGYLLLFTHELYDPHGVWSRVQAATREEPSALLGLWPVVVAERIGTLIQVGPASVLPVLPSERRPVPGVPLGRLDVGDVERLLRACNPGDERSWPPLGSQRTPALIRLGLGVRWRGLEVATVAGAVLACRHRTPPLPGMRMLDRRRTRSREVLGPIPRLIHELRVDGAEPGDALSQGFAMVIAWAVSTRAWEGGAGQAPVELTEEQDLVMRIPQDSACNILNQEPGVVIRSMLTRLGELPGAGDRHAIQDWFTRSGLPALSFEDQGAHLVVRWSVQTTQPRTTRGPHRAGSLGREAGKARILALIDQAGRPLAATVLVGKVSAPAPTVRRWLGELVDEGVLERTATSPRDPRQSYRRPAR